MHLCSARLGWRDDLDTSDGRFRVGWPLVGRRSKPRRPDTPTTGDARRRFGSQARLIAMSLATLGVLAMMPALATGIDSAADTAPVHGTATSKEDDPTSRSAGAGVRVVRDENGFVFHIDGEPFTVKGAGFGWREAVGVTDLDAVAAAGATTIRTWQPEDLDTVLDAASQAGLRVLAGLGGGAAVAGLDYADTEAVDARHERVLDVVARHRDHPALLGWILANEPNLPVHDGDAVAGPDRRTWAALGRLATAVEDLDPRHPLTVTFAYTDTLVDEVTALLEHTDAIDFVSLQAYGALTVLPDTIAALPADLPVVVTEFGPIGHWEMPATDWGREIEEPSGPKADALAQRWRDLERADTNGRLLGGYVFLWGQKQERTPTWYSLYTPGGGRTASVDAFETLWRGKPPANLAPRGLALTLDGRDAFSSVRVSPGARVVARFDVADPDDDPLAVEWTLRPEVEARSQGGMPETTPAPLTVERLAARHVATGFELVFHAPETPGEYRLFAHATDDHGGDGYANLPFLVE